MACCLIVTASKSTSTSTADDLTAGVSVLITSINYPPEHTGIGPYVGHIAEHLAGRGHPVEVITGIPHYPSWLVGAGYKWRLRRTERRNGVLLRRLRHYVPARQSAIRRGAYEATFLLNGLFTRARTRPGVVLVVSPSLAAAMTGQRLARWAGAPSAILVQDLMGSAAGQSGIAGGGRVAKLTEAIESRVLRSADVVGVVHESFAAKVVSLGVPSERVHVVRNWSHIGRTDVQRPSLRAEFGWDTNLQVVLHAGNMGLKQGLDVVVAAARLAERSAPHLRFVLLGDGSTKQSLVDSARGLDNVIFLPPLDDYAFPRALAAADALLVTQRSTVLDMSLPSKLTSYFTAGRPVIASVATGGGTAAEVLRAGAGLVIEAEDPQALVEAASRLWTDPTAAEAMGQAGQHYAAAQLGMAAGLTRIRRLLWQAMQEQPPR